MVLGHAVAGADDGVGTVYLAGLPLWNSQMGSGLHLPVSFPAVGCPDACLAGLRGPPTLAINAGWGAVPTHHHPQLPVQQHTPPRIVTHLHHRPVLHHSWNPRGKWGRATRQVASTSSLSSMDLTSVIETRPGVRSGKPCFVGARIAVYDVLDYLASGMTIDEIVADFPELTAEHVRAAIEFAAMRERRLATPA